MDFIRNLQFRQINIQITDSLTETFNFPNGETPENIISGIQ